VDDEVASGYSCTSVLAGAAVAALALAALVRAAAGVVVLVGVVLAGAVAALALAALVRAAADVVVLVGVVLAGAVVVVLCAVAALPCTSVGTSLLSSWPHRFSRFGWQRQRQLRFCRWVYSSSSAPAKLPAPFPQSEEEPALAAVVFVASALVVLDHEDNQPHPPP
jgi:hypothetical protein